MEMLEVLWVRIAGDMQNLVYALLASTEETMEIMDRSEIIGVFDPHYQT